MINRTVLPRNFEDGFECVVDQDFDGTFRLLIYDVSDGYMDQFSPIEDGILMEVLEVTSDKTTWSDTAEDWIANWSKDNAQAF